MDTDLLELSGFGSEKAPNIRPKDSPTAGGKEENAKGGAFLTSFESKLNI